MKDFELEDCDICDIIRYDINHETLTHLEFFLKGNSVLNKLAKKLSGVSLENIFKNKSKIIEYAPFLVRFIDELEIAQKNIAIKSAIQKFHKK